MPSVSLEREAVAEIKREGSDRYKEVAYAQAQAKLLSCSHHLILDLSLMRPLFAGSVLVTGGGDIPDVLDVLGDPLPYAPRE